MPTTIKTVYVIQKYHKVAEEWFTAFQGVFENINLDAAIRVLDKYKISFPADKWRLVEQTIVQRVIEIKTESKNA
jgi:hypothetical protein